ncbi:MAG: YebC/PmpR family DNA-binding transcriptional regulator [Candidatus Magnetoovum sp. WYHC-5]|nr:YebC/PmpR family DNA-binding transcriptional regulator [Candidatus Magnetoovum sp. WYHC-5]
MSGHSKWAQIKRKKASTDAKRGKVFSKIVKEISVAARMGGGDPDGNPRLRTAIEKAKEANMPVDNVKKAIQKGTGELPGSIYEEAVYEGYGPGGVAILIEALTDNKNRTVSEVRYLLSKNGGSLGEAGCVSWMFEKKGLILISKESTDEDTLLEISLSAGALDMKNEPDVDNYEIYTAPEELFQVKDAVAKNKIPILSAELSMVPKNTLRVEGAQAEQVLRLVEVLEDNDDVQNVHTNFDIPEEMMASP